jgi:hypothetical protein
MNLADLGWADGIPDWCEKTFPRCAFHTRNHSPTKVQAFVDFGLETIR